MLPVPILEGEKTGQEVEKKSGGFFSVDTYTKYVPTVLHATHVAIL